jgi:hypothetical protein
MGRYAEPRQNITWNSPLLRLVKALAGVLKRRGYVGQDALWEAVSDRLPDISLRILETQYNMIDVLREVEAQGRELTPNRLYGRADVVYRKGYEEKDSEFLAVVESLVGVPEVDPRPTPTTTAEPVHTTKRIFPTEMGEAIFKRDNNRCVYCLCPLGAGMSPGVIDHLVPWVGGGESVIWNGVAACARCNTEKGDMSVIEYMRLRAVREQERGRRIPKINVA